MALDETHRQQLLRLARESIQRGLAGDKLLPYPQSALPAELAAPGATFVTLRIDSELRGCCGSIDSQRPLGEDLWRNAWASAFNDPRFPPLTMTEYPGIDVHISVLGALEPIPVQSEAELLRMLRPGVDGLLLRLRDSQATFLPTVWSQLPSPSEFVRELKRKAGWPGEFWSAELEYYRYTTESFGERH